MEERLVLHRAYRNQECRDYARARARRERAERAADRKRRAQERATRPEVTPATVESPQYADWVKATTTITASGTSIATAWTSTGSWVSPSGTAYLNPSQNGIYYGTVTSTPVDYSTITGSGALYGYSVDQYT